MARYCVSSISIALLVDGTRRTRTLLLQNEFDEEDNEGEGVMDDDDDDASRYAGLGRRL